MKIRRLTVAVVLVMCTLTFAWIQRASAFELASGLEEPVQIHGFLSQGFMLSSKNNYLARSTEGSFEFSEVGINFTQRLSEELRAGVQLFARDLGPTGNYEAKFDWFYLDYRFADWLGLRAGRTKVPFGLYNEFNDIDSARIQILLPQSIYPIQNRDFLLAQTGAELYGRLSLEEAGALDYRLYLGTIFLDSPYRPGNTFQVNEIGFRYFGGGRLLWETPLQGLTVGGSAQALRLDTTLFGADGAQAEVQLPALLWVASAEYLHEDLGFALEYSRWHVKSRSDNPDLFPRAETTSERAYLMGNYRMSERLSAGLYYSLLYPNTDDRRGREAQQHDLALSGRLDLTEHWLLKLEGHYLVGTAALNATLNDNRPPSELTRRWLAGFAKTTVYF